MEGPFSRNVQELLAAVIRTIFLAFIAERRGIRLRRVLIPTGIRVLGGGVQVGDIAVRNLSGTSKKRHCGNGEKSKKYSFHNKLKYACMSACEALIELCADPHQKPLFFAKFGTLNKGLALLV